MWMPHHNVLKSELYFLWYVQMTYVRNMIFKRKMKSQNHRMVRFGRTI